MDEQELSQEAETKYTIIKHYCKKKKKKHESYPKFINKSHQPRAATSPECSCKESQKQYFVM